MNMDNPNTVPFLDLITPHKDLKAELCEVLSSALDTAGFIGGPMVERFEEEFARFCDTRYCVGVASGTDALRFALLAAGVGPGDVVVTVSNTFIATVEAVSQCGAFPVFVDVDERTQNLDPNKLIEYVDTRCHLDTATGRLHDRQSGRRVAAVVPVHLYGQMADMDPILEIAGRYGLVVIEDACQAHGAKYFSRKHNRWFTAGSMGQAAAFSFYPGKNLGACGEAGALTTNDAELAKTARMLRDHGQSQKYHHEIEGYNGRLDSIQAGMLSVKLRHLSEWTDRRRSAAALYCDLFASTPDAVVLPFEPEWAYAVYHLFVVRVQNRGELMTRLAQNGVGTAIHYPIPLHQQKAYRGLGYPLGALPVTEKLAPQILSLPMYPQLKPKQQERVVDAILDFVGAAPIAV